MKEKKRTRQIRNIKMQFRKISNAPKSIFYEGNKMYNALPSEIKQHEKPEQFKRMLKEYISGNVN